MKIRRKVLAAGIAAALASTSALADPPVDIPGIPTVFCFRITDMERPEDAYTTGDSATGTVMAGHENRFLIEFEVLNWTSRDAIGMHLATTVANDATIVGAGIDSDGRGGTVGAVGGDPKYGEIDYVNGGSASGHSDPVPHQSGRGNNAIANDWVVRDQTATSVLFDADVTFTDGGGYGGYGGGYGGVETPSGFGGFLDANVGATPLENVDLIGQAFGLAFGFDRGEKIPGLGTDATGDTAIDGGPASDGTGGYSDAGPSDFVADQAPTQGDGNVLDGFVLEVDGLGVGDTLSFNWFLLEEGFAFDNDGDGDFLTSEEDTGGDSPGAAGCIDEPLACYDPIGTAFGGNQFGFGVFELTRLADDGTGALPPALFAGGSPLNQSPITFFQADSDAGGKIGVFDLPNRAVVAGNFGAGVTAPFQNQGNNIFGVGTNVALSEPGMLAMLGGGLLGLLGLRRRRAR